MITARLTLRAVPLVVAVAVVEAEMPGVGIVAVARAVGIVVVARILRARPAGVGAAI